MSAKTVLSAALVWSAFGLYGASAQEPYPSAALPAVPIPAIENDAAAAPSEAPPAALSPYMSYQRPDCCGPIGGSGPIQIELYGGSGLSFPFGNNVFDRILDLGWVVDGGARSLFFTPSKNAAWVVDLGITNIWNHANRPDVRIPLHLAGFGTPLATPEVTAAGNPGVTVSSLNRTFVGLGLGRDWFLGDHEHGGASWRFGLDAAFRYGTSKLELNQIRHRTDTLAGAAAGAHLTVEVPCGASVLVAGFRAEWAYTWSDILQVQNNSDLSEFNVMVQLGVRF